VVFLSSETQLQKVLSTRGQTALEKLVVMDAVAGDDAVRMARWNLTAGQTSGIACRPSDYGHAASPDDLATIIYTSVRPARLGVMLTPWQMASNLRYR